MKLSPELVSDILAGRGQRTPPAVDGKPVDALAATLPVAGKRKAKDLVEFRLLRSPLLSAYDAGFWAEWTLPIPIEARGNSRADRRADAGAIGKQRWQLVRAIAKDWLIWGPLGNYCRQHGNLLITFTRLGGRNVDRSNLPRCFKHIEDSLAAIMGCDDGWPTWLADWKQEAGDRVGMRFRLEKGT